MPKVLTKGYLGQSYLGGLAGLEMLYSGRYSLSGHLLSIEGIHDGW
jgi:hypothetical protein